MRRSFRRSSTPTGVPLFENLADRLQGIFRNLSGQGRLSPDNIRESLRDVRRALLEADVPVGVAKEFVARVEAKAVGEDVLKSLTPGQQVIGIVRDEIVAMLGDTRVGLAGSPHVPTVILLAGLQGSGKTTFAGKLALWLKARNKRTLLVSADVYRPAAIDQLERVAKGADAGFWRAPDGTKPHDIAVGALEQARTRGFDFLILDTAGRLHIDDELMGELEDLKRTVRAIAKTEQWVARASDKEIAQTIGRYFTDLPPAILEAACTRYKKLGIWGKDPILPRAGYDRLRDGLVSGGFVSPGATFEQAVDNSLAEELLRE